tara:strand:+ start:3066 stop:3320 length:255 start_codon:yes stop_codon:yes gene_type:complete
MLDWNDTFTTVSKNVHSDNTAKQCTLLAQLVAEPIAITWKWNMPVPMAEEYFLRSQENASLDPLSESTFLVKPLSKWVRNEPTI